MRTPRRPLAVATALGLGLALAALPAASVTVPLTRAAARLVHVPNGTVSALRFTNGLPVPLLYLPTQVTVAVSIGTPPQELVVVFDTGSSALVVPDAACAACRSLNRFRPERSSTYKQQECNANCVCVDTGCASEVTYADGSGATGRLVEDDFAVGAVQTRTGVFGLMDHQTVVDGVPPVFNDNPEVDGIWGVAYQSLNCQPLGSRYCLPTVMDKLMQDNTFPQQNLFSLWVGESDERPGVLSLGEVDKAYHYAATMRWIPVREELYYDVPLTSLAVGTHFIVENQPELLGIPAIVDSGTTLLLLSNKAWKQLTAMIRPLFCTDPSRYLDYWCSGQTVWDQTSVMVYDLDPEKLPLYPTFFFYFGKQVIPVTSDFYWRRCDWCPQDRPRYYFGLAPSGTDMTILGDIFMRPYYVVFDRVHRQVGFALAYVYGPDALPVAPPAPDDPSLEKELFLPLWAITATATGMGTCLLLVVWVSCMYRKGKVPHERKRHRHHNAQRHPAHYSLQYPPPPAAGPGTNLLDPGLAPGPAVYNTFTPKDPLT